MAKILLSNGSVAMATSFLQSLFRQMFSNSLSSISDWVSSIEGNKVLKRLHYVCFTTKRQSFIHCSCCLSFWFACLSKPKLGVNQLTPPKPRMNNLNQAKNWMKPSWYSTEENDKWRLPWQTSALLLSLRLDLQTRRQMAIHVWKDGIFAQSTICMKLNATQVHGAANRVYPGMDIWNARLLLKLW